MKLVRFSGLLAAGCALILMAFPASSEGGVVNRDVDGLQITIYEMGSNNQKPLYKAGYSIIIDGNKATQITTIKNLKGETVATEKLVEVDGKFFQYEYQRLEAKEGGTVTLKGDTLHFVYTKKEKTKTYETELPDRFVIGPALTAYVRTQWETILKGEDLKIKYGVLDRRDIYRFKLFKVGTEKRGDEEVIIVKMMPDTWLISKLVDPLFFTFSNDGSKVYQLEGRIIPLKKVGKKWKTQDAITVYHHELHEKVELPEKAD